MHVTHSFKEVQESSLKVSMLSNSLFCLWGTLLVRCVRVGCKPVQSLHDTSGLEVSLHAGVSQAAP